MLDIGTIFRVLGYNDIRCRRNRRKNTRLIPVTSLEIVTSLSSFKIDTLLEVKVDNSSKYYFRTSKTRRNSFTVLLF